MSRRWCTCLRCRHGSAWRYSGWTREHEVVGYGPHAHEFFEMLLFESGGGVHVVDGVEHRARRGVAWLLRPGVSHDLAGLSDARGWLVIASSDVLGLPPWDNGATTWPAHPLLGAFCHVEPSGRPIPLQLSSRRLRRWLDWVLQLHGEVQAARPGYEHAARALLQLLLVDAARLVPAPVEAATHPLVERALQHVEAVFRGRFPWRTSPAPSPSRRDISPRLFVDKRSNPPWQGGGRVCTAPLRAHDGCPPT